MSHPSGLDSDGCGGCESVCWAGGPPAGQWHVASTSTVVTPWLVTSATVVTRRTVVYTVVGSWRKYCVTVSALPAPSLQCAVWTCPTSITVWTLVMVVSMA